MNKRLIKGISFVILILGSVAAHSAWDPNELAELDTKSQEALTAFKEADSGVQGFLDAAAGYVVIPTVGKAGFGIGGARGKGILYEGGVPTAIVTLTQLSIGFQAGGQAYSEFLFFEDETTLSNFKGGNFELGAQASAVAIKTGASAETVFKNGIAIFTQAKGGLMYEASVGGQKFKVEAK